MRIYVAYVAPDGEVLVALDVAAGTTVADALGLHAVTERLPVAPDPAGLAIFGERVSGATPLRDGDRIEITRPLRADPKHMRRDRAGRHAATGKTPPRRRRGLRTAG